MNKVDNRPRCGICEYKLVKNGKTTAGRTRWRCKHCGASTAQDRPDITVKAQFQLWLDWLLLGWSQRQLPVSHSKFKRDIAGCWQITPEAVITGESHRWIMLDSTYFNGMCVLIANTKEHVVN